MKFKKMVTFCVLSTFLLSANTQAAFFRSKAKSKPVTKQLEAKPLPKVKTFKVAGSKTKGGLNPTQRLKGAYRDAILDSSYIGLLGLSLSGFTAGISGIVGAGVAGVIQAGIGLKYWAHKRDRLPIMLPEKLQSSENIRFRSLAKFVKKNKMCGEGAEPKNIFVKKIKSAQRVIDFEKGDPNNGFILSSTPPFKDFYAIDKIHCKTTPTVPAQAKSEATQKQPVEEIPSSDAPLYGPDYYGKNHYNQTQFQPTSTSSVRVR